jgi:hypothetical protein
LGNDTNSLKDRLVFFVSMAELSGQDTVDLEVAVEVFMASSSTFLETVDLRCILMVTDGTSWVFIDGVRNDFLPHRNLALQSIG